MGRSDFGLQGRTQHYSSRTGIYGVIRLYSAHGLMDRSLPTCLCLLLTTA